MRVCAGWGGRRGSLSKYSMCTLRQRTSHGWLTRACLLTRNRGQLLLAVVGILHAACTYVHAPLLLIVVVGGGWVGSGSSSSGWVRSLCLNLH